MACGHGLKQEVVAVGEATTEGTTVVVMVQGVENLMSWRSSWRALAGRASARAAVALRGIGRGRSERERLRKKRD